MRKILTILFFIAILSGCATYKFQKSTSGSSQGYLASYDGKLIPEYTVGKEKSLPDLTLAKERFKRRRPIVEYYYKKTGQIESRWKENFWSFPAMVVDFTAGILRWPFTAVSDYRYNHNPKYKEKIDKLDEENEAFEKASINSYKEKLAAYIDKDLANEHLPESSIAAEPLPQIPVAPEAQVPVTKTESLAPPAETAALPVVEQALPAVAPVAPPVAVIVAKPQKGYSPLKVQFSGQKSYSKLGKIVSYFWDFGDGDTSTKKNPENTYWSTTYGLRKFTAELTVKDNAGGASSATETIEVSTR